jgi:hypothetical protein
VFNSEKAVKSLDALLFRFEQVDGRAGPGEEPAATPTKR